MAPMRQFPRQRTQTEAKAVVAMLLGFASFVLGPATGIPAVIVGSVARRDIARSGGALTGSHLAGAGTLAGFFGTGFFVVLLLWLGSAFISPQTEAALQSAADDSASHAKVTAPVRAAPEHVDLELLHTKR